MIKIANRQIFIFFFDFFKKNMGPSNMGNPLYLAICQKKWFFQFKHICTKLYVLIWG